MNKHIGRMAAALAAAMFFALSSVACNGEWGEDWRSDEDGVNYVSSEHTLAHTTNDRLYAWGGNYYGQLGLGTSDGNAHPTPTYVGTGSDWGYMDKGAHHSLAFKRDGSLWAWGGNHYGQLGLGDTGQRNTPTRVGADKDWKTVKVGAHHSLAVKKDGSLWAWGRNDHGQLGLGDTGQRNTPVRVGADNDWRGGDYLLAGAHHSLAVKTDGSLWAWGANDYGQLGLGDTNGRNTPTRVGEDNNWSESWTDGSHTLAVKTDGSIWAWGRNDYGQLGLGDTGQRNTPTRVGEANDWDSVFAGAYHSLAIKKDKSLWAWGRNEHGQLGLGSSDGDPHPTPARVGADNDWSFFLRTSGSYSMVCKPPAFPGGNGFAWGRNNFGQLGLGDTNDRNVPTQQVRGGSQAAPRGGVEDAAPVGAGDLDWSREAADYARPGHQDGHGSPRRH